MLERIVIGCIVIRSKIIDESSGCGYPSQSYRQPSICIMIVGVIRVVGRRRALMLGCTIDQLDGIRNSLSNSCPLGRARGRGPI